MTTGIPENGTAGAPKIGARFDGWVRRSPWGAVLTVVGALVWFAVAAVVYRRLAPHTERMLSVEFGGSPAQIATLIAGHQPDYARALTADYLFIAGYGIAISAASLVGRAIAFTTGARRCATAAAAATVLAVVCDVAENEFLRPVVHNPAGSDHGFAVAAQAFAFAKWVLIVPAAFVAVVAVLTTLWRAGRGPNTKLVEPVGTDNDGKDIPLVQRPAVDTDAALDAAGTARSAWRANNRLPAGRERGGVGFCVSGGGIRSATFGLGAMDSLRPLLREARYLVSVSGGGYATGAMQLALNEKSVATPADVYGGGSAELDYTRKHGRYIAEGAAEWTVALVRLLRGIVVNLLVLGLLVVVVGRVVAHVYAEFPHNLMATGTWPPPAGISWAVGVTLGLALAIYIAGIWLQPSLGSGLNRVTKRAAAALGGVGALLAVVGIGLPLLAWVARQPPGVPAGTLGVVSTLSTWVAAIVALGKRPAVGNEAKKVWARWTKGSPKQRSLAADATVVVALLLVAAALFLLLGIVLANTGRLTARSAWPGGYDEWVYSLVAIAALGYLGTVDQVRWSLHPFYRRRLATAFAVRRRRRNGHVEAKRYDFDREETPLHTYAKRHVSAAPRNPPAAGGYDFPQVIFSCAAHDSERKVTVPGRRVVPWTMAADYVGSPMIGWAHTAELYERVPSVLSADLTVQAAQAISGAAIASQMGRMQRSYTRLLTIANARLGSWLPNPAYIHQLAGENAAWCLPRLPRQRYLSTLARELLASFSGDGPLVYVTDGGHYENLGLVELLRHRPRLAVCIDGSGDRPDVAATFAQAIQLAYEELGVVITPEDAGGLGAGAAASAAAAPDQLVEELTKRLSKSCVVTADVTYPDLGQPDLAAYRGTLVLAKATLTREMPFEILAHASRNPSFPNDTTADQWFDFAQFDAYHALGRYVGARAMAAVTAKAAAETRARVPAQRASAGGNTIAFPDGEHGQLVIRLDAAGPRKPQRA